MIVHKCDICKKEMQMWITIKVDVEASDKLANIADLTKYIGTLEICPECYRKGPTTNS